MKRTITALAAALLLTSCSAPDESTQPAAEPVPTTAPAPGFDAPAEFGEPVTFPDGAEVTVTANGSREIVEDDMVEHAPDDVIASFTIEVVNNTEARLEAAYLMPSTAFGDGFAESGTMISNADLGAIFPGETAKGEFERMLPGAEVDVVRVSVPDPSMTGPDAVFEGSVE